MRAHRIISLCFMMSSASTSFFVRADNVVRITSSSSKEEIANVDKKSDKLTTDNEKFIKESGEYDWDVLIFTQQWPITTCYEWVEDNDSHKCNLPDKKEFWTIHGIWPTKFGTIGPSFCNKTAKFDIKELEEIEKNLELFWPSIEKGFPQSTFWQHEWLKHGTCASVLSDLNDEQKYFKKGLEWRNKYLVSKILASSGIHPDTLITVQNIHDAIWKFLKKNPSIHCVQDEETKTNLLSEIRLCFSKNLELTNCDGVMEGKYGENGKVLTNCQLNDPVHYPSTVPKQFRKSWTVPVVNIYNLINFLIWYTL